MVSPDLPDATPACRVLLDFEGGEAAERCLIRAEGILDRHGCFDLEWALAGAEMSEATQIVLDVDRLSHVDADGLRVLLDVSRRAAGMGRRLQITRGTGHVADMLRLTALDQSLPFD